MANAKYKRGTDGYFQAKVWDGTYVNGVKHRIPLRSKKSSKDLENMVIDHNEKLRERSYIRKSDITFLNYAREWKKIYKSSLSGNTLAMYDNIIEKHLCNLNCKISDVNRIHYYSLMNSITGNRTKQQVSMTFKQIIKSAIKDKLLPSSTLDEIFSDAVKIKYKSPEKRALTEQEKQSIFNANFSKYDKAFVYILYGCGLRRGEALALTRFDISLERKELTVNKALAFDGNNSYLKDTKTVNGSRTVPIPDITFDFLAEYISCLNGTLLFPFKNEKYITKSSYIKTWKRIIKNLNEVSDEPITNLTAHIFRHNYCASLCYMIPEISIKKIAELLGDTDKMVIEVYNHVIEKKEKPHDVVRNALAL
jgi:integrase